ncbi:MAG: TonB family protein [Janthinobacterium lividum]
MKHFAFFLLISALGGTRAYAQQTPGKPVFLDKNFALTSSEAGATYRRETEYTSKRGGVVHDYYLSGKPARSTAYSNITRQQLDGVAERWDEQGQLRLHREYADGQPSGELRTYYPSGQLRRREHYAKGQRLDGACYGPAGQPQAFTPYETLPVYSEGDGSLATVIQVASREFRYPVEALRAGLTGQVIAGFTVNETGDVTNIRIIKPLSTAVDAEALRAMQRIRSFTSPGQLDGEPTSMEFTVPFNLAIR